MYWIYAMDIPLKFVTSTKISLQQCQCHCLHLLRVSVNYEAINSHPDGAECLNESMEIRNEPDPIVLIVIVYYNKYWFASKLRYIYYIRLFYIFMKEKEEKMPTFSIESPN